MRAHLLLTFPLLLACQNQKQGEVSRPVTSSTGTALTPQQDGMRAPLTVTLTGPETVAPDSEVVVNLDIQRAAVGPEPMELLVELPPGVKVASGLAVESIVDTAQLHVRRTLRLQVGTVPAQDLVASVKTGGASWGVVGKATYRFGRPAPEFKQPPRAGQELKVGGATMGRGIPVDAATQK